MVSTAGMPIMPRQTNYFPIIKQAVLRINDGYNLEILCRMETRTSDRSASRSLQVLQKTSSRLLSLPAELRESIWKLTLASTVLVPRSKDSIIRCDRQSVDLLLVCKCVHNEAKRFFYSNVLLLEDMDSIRRLYDFGFDQYKRPVLIGHVKLPLRGDDLTEEAAMVADALTTNAMIDADVFEELEERQRMSRYVLYHKFAKIELQKMWSSKLRSVMESVRPYHVEISLRHSSCQPMGCCSMIGMALQAVHEVFEHYPDRRFTISISDSSPEGGQLVADAPVVEGLKKVKHIGSLRIEGLPTCVDSLSTILSELSEMTDEERESLGRYAR